MTVTTLPATSAEFEQFDREHRASALRYACRLVPERYAEDVVQEALLRVWRRWERTDSDAHRLNLLYKIVHDLAANVRRSWKNNPLELTDDLEPLPFPPVPCAAEELVRSEWWGRVLGAFAEVPERFRHIVHAQVLDGTTVEEISEGCGVPVPTLRVYKHRGLKVLRERVQEIGAPCLALMGRIERRVEACIYAPGGPNALAQIVAAATLVLVPSTGRDSTVAEVRITAPSSVPVSAEEWSRPALSAEYVNPRRAPSVPAAPRQGAAPAAPPNQPRRLPDPPAPGEVCVGAKCVGEDKGPGDRVCLENGQEWRIVCQKQSAVPVCDGLPQSDYLSCTRHGKSGPIGSGDPSMP